tara:strand:- start:815 stop:1306 length:492 start_codon:yes stop_codon:yes gene_type:complete
MDDSVIKVLRRNGSWHNSKVEQEKIAKSHSIDHGSKVLEDDFKLDEKFKILASEIKKRMNTKEVSEKDNPKKTFITETNNSHLEDLNRLKSKILPYLKKLEKLIIKRQDCLKNLSEIDNNLDQIYKDISDIKKNYLLSINNLKKNMSFFDDSLEIIKSAKEEK